MTTPIEPELPIDDYDSLRDYRAAISGDGARLAAARRRVELTSDVLRMRVLAAIKAGMSENEAAKLAGVTRQTVRTWQGK